METVSEETVTYAVEPGTQLTSEGIGQAFVHRFPHLGEICKAALPELPLRFANGDLHKVYNQHVRGVIKRAEERGTLIDLDFESFRRMLIEIGAVGRQIAETEYYSEAEFEYTVPSSLVISGDDVLCLHPIFSSAYPRMSRNQDKLYIYPYGSNPKVRIGSYWR